MLLYADLVRMRMLTGADPDELLAEALDQFPDNCVLLWLRSRLLIRRGAYRQALEPLDRIASMDPATLPDKGPSYDEELLRDLPHEARGLCMFRLGRYAEAAQEYAAALAFQPESAEYRAKLALATARAFAGRR